MPSGQQRRPWGKLAATTAAALGIVIAAAAVASAHVTISSPDAEQGGFGKLVFRVPTESDTASTVKLAVHLPTATPFPSVSVKEHPGWTVTTTETKLAAPVTTDEGFTVDKAVSSVTWTAQHGQGIKPGEFDEFELSVGPFPKSSKLMFPAVQTYSDGTVVRWDQPTKEGEAEPEHPAPTLVVPASAAGTPAQTAGAAGGAGSRASGSDNLARGLAAGGLALGVVALAFAIARRRPPADRAATARTNAGSHAGTPS